MKELLLLSGKGGTGKTSLVNAFIALGGFQGLFDCDVDAPNLGLLWQEDGLVELEDYYGMDKVFIESEKCLACGKCKESCRFKAIELVDHKYRVNKYACEGCGVCERVCPSQAISYRKNIAGQIRVQRGERFLSTARLKMGEGNSGLLVSELKKKGRNEKFAYSIIDGSPGIGCPVMASIAGVDLVLIVTEPSRSGLADLDRIVRTCRSFGVDFLVAINKYDISLENTARIEDYCRKEAIELVGKLPFEDSYNRLLNNRKTFLEGSEELVGEVKKIYERTFEILRRM